METQINESNGAGNWIAFLFGVMFNFLVRFDLDHAIDYATQAIMGGLICLFFKIVGDMISPKVRGWVGRVWRRWR